MKMENELELMLRAAETEFKQLRKERRGGERARKIVAMRSAALLMDYAETGNNRTLAEAIVKLVVASEEVK